MRKRHAWVQGGLAVAVTMAFCFASTVASAQSVTTERQTVNTPAAAPAAGTTVVQAPPQQVQVQPAAPTSTKNVTTETHNDNYMGTIAKNTLYGAVAGGLVGGAVYFLARDSFSATSIAYWASGGAVLGAAVGIVEVSNREERNERAVSYLLNGKKTNFAFVPRLVNVRF